MAITLTYNTTTIELPEDLQWVDEHDWVTVREDVQYTLTGSVVITTNKVQAGRPITLQGGDDYAWINEDAISSIRALAEADATMTLTINDRSFRVRFRYGDGAISATRIFPGIEWFNNVIIRLREVQD